MTERVVVVGAGIAGLCFAERLLRLRPDVELRVLEASDRAGGLIQTHREEGYLLECGPETLVDDGSGLSGLVADLELGARVRRPSAEAAIRYVVKKQKLVALPRGPKLLFSSLLPLRSRLGLLLEPMRWRAADPEESFASFVKRRLGAQVLEQLAEPFAAGIYAGVPEEMEMAACFPRLWEAEQTHGSLLRGARRMKLAPGSILSFEDGNEELTRNLCARLGTRIQLSRRVTGIKPRASGGFDLDVYGERLQADRVVLTQKAPLAARLLEGIRPRLAQELDAIRFVDIVTVHLGYRDEDVPSRCEGFGFLIPRREARSRVLGVLFSSRLFERRAPDGTRLFRVMLGGGRNPGLLPAEDGPLLEESERVLRDLAGVRGKPVFSRIWKLEGPLPVYAPGHSARLRRIDAELQELPGLSLAGISYRASSVAGCIRDARELAERLAAVEGAKAVSLKSE